MKNFVKDADKLFNGFEKFMNPITKVPIIGNAIKGVYQAVKLPYNTVKMVSNPSIDSASQVFNDFKNILGKGKGKGKPLNKLKR